MTTTVTALHLDIQPTRRPEALDLRPQLREALRAGPLEGASRLLCLSHHTTAGFLDQRLRRRLGPEASRVEAFLKALGSVFPPEAGYEHDRLHLRDELSDAQKATEPLNADAHLAFIGGGFSNCSMVEARDDSPLWFVDLDGVYLDREARPVRRDRRATVVGYHREETVGTLSVEVPVPERPGVVRLDDPEVGLLDRIQEVVDREGLTAGRVQLHLAAPTPGVGITVNEFEALLMERDLTRVLADPLGFTRSGTQALSRVLASLGVHGARLERLLGRALAHPATRVLRMSRGVSLGVLAPDMVEGGVEANGQGGGQAGGHSGGQGRGQLVLGTYQSPLLVQRCGPSGGRRTVEIRVRRLR